MVGMLPSEWEGEKQRRAALAGYKALLEHLALIEFFNPSATVPDIVRAARFMLDRYPCNINDKE